MCRYIVDLDVMFISAINVLILHHSCFQGNMLIPAVTSFVKDKIAPKFCPVSRHFIIELPSFSA